MHLRHSFRTKRPKSFVRRHLILFFILPIIIGGGVLAGWWLVSQKEKEIVAFEASTAASYKELDEEIAVIKARKAEEERLRKLALAKKTAQEVITTPESKADQIDATSCNVSGVRNNPASIDVFVNKKHCIQPLTYAPTDLVTVHGATLSRKAVDDFKKMYAAAAAAGQGFSVTSSYRSYSNQVTTYNYWVSVSGVTEADTYSARPGYSEHQTGFTIDVANATGSCALDCFGTTTQYKWMQQHAATYGFIQRYYAGMESITGYGAEEWHYRYVGPTVALDMKAKGIKTLEQYWNLPGGTY